MADPEDLHIPGAEDSDAEDDVLPNDGATFQKRVPLKSRNGDEIYHIGIIDYL